MIKFPRIYRIITESHLLTISLLSLFLFCFVLLGFDVLSNTQKMLKLNRERAEIAAKIYYWQKVVEKYKDYRDGYFQLSILEYQLGEMKKARIYLEKVFRLDPNFAKGRELEKILASKSIRY